MKILLVDDDTFLSTALAELLRANHYTIDLAHDGQLGLDLAMSVEYDLILLDWLVPKLDGVSLCRKLRFHGCSKPILLLTAKNTHTDIVTGLDAGADDYMIKPYHSEALLAKIRSLLRRNSTFSPSQLTWENLCLDQISGKITYNNQIIPLTATEYKLLELFLNNPNRVFSRMVILDRLWGFDDAPIENAVTTHIKDLRKKLKAGGLTQDIIETVYGMGYRLKSPTNSNTDMSLVNIDINKALVHPGTDTNTDILPEKNSSPDLTAINRVLEKFRNSFTQQIAILEEAKTALLAANLHQDLQQQAQQEAHKLAGSMGTFGYPEGSRLARLLENLLKLNRAFTDDEINQFSQLVSALQQELIKFPITTPETITNQPKPIQETYRVLVIDDDTILTEKLLTEATGWGMRMKIAPDLKQAKLRLDLSLPDAVLLDLSFPTTAEDGLTLLQDLAENYPNLPIIVFTGRNTLDDRLAASRLGAKSFIQKPATTEQIFQALTRVLPQEKPAEAKILIVDDDSVMLSILSALLTPWGLQVITLSQPQQFWQVLTATSPDLLLLDLEMPIINGLELCQVVRQDIQWGNLPILVVTGHNDADSLQKAFSAGADDFITKPVLGPELVTRIISRIERVRMRLQSGKKKL